MRGLVGFVIVWLYPAVRVPSLPGYRVLVRSGRLFERCASFGTTPSWLRAPLSRSRPQVSPKIAVAFWKHRGRLLQVPNDLRRDAKVVQRAVPGHRRVRDRLRAPQGRGLFGVTVALVVAAADVVGALSIARRSVERLFEYQAIPRGGGMMADGAGRLL